VTGNDTGKGNLLAALAEAEILIGLEKKPTSTLLNFEIVVEL